MQPDDCRHIMTTGRQCGSPRLAGADFCFFHARMRSRHRAAIGPEKVETIVPVVDGDSYLVAMEAMPRPGALDLGPLEDRAAVQMAISTVVNALAANRIHRDRATALLYGLQLASSNCANSDHGFTGHHSPVQAVTELPDGTELAPEYDPADDPVLLSGVDDEEDDVNDAEEVQPNQDFAFNPRRI